MMRNTDRHDDLPAVETPEDVAVLYSWANLHGAKYRDFSASRREYRAQLRRRAAEQVRESELQAKDEAELAAAHAARQAEALAREADRAAEHQRERDNAAAEFARLEALRQAEEAARIATAERIEAARRSEAAALADAAARREEREIAEAAASAQRQSARYADSEQRRRQLDATTSSIPGQISDPYTPLPQQAALLEPASSGPAPQPEIYLEPVRRTPIRTDPKPAPAALTAANDRENNTQMSDWTSSHFSDDDRPAPAPSSASFRPRGYRPDNASGVRRIVRSPEFEEPAERDPGPTMHQAVQPIAPPPIVPRSDRSGTSASGLEALRPSRMESINGQDSGFGSESARLHADAGRRPAAPLVARSESRYPSAGRPSNLAAHDPSSNRSEERSASQGDVRSDWNRPVTPTARGGVVSPFSQPPLSSARSGQPTEGYTRRSYEPEDRHSGPARESYEPRPTANEPTYPNESPRLRPAPIQSARTQPQGATPAWISEGGDTSRDRRQTTPEAQQPPSPDTLQQSRERVASRWYALKGVFDQPGTALSEPQPIRQKEVRTPVLAIFSLAGGVGKTSLIATLGRALSSLGEKVLLTDTTTHGILPFYFGASELRQGTVRTFSPPSGSTDAPIYLVSYDADGRRNDETAEETLADEVTANSRGTHRVLLDLAAGSAWVVRRLARTNPLILVPVTPDMNSVISLQAVEKLFAGVHNADGQPPQVFFLLNHFDASLPLHLDVREVLRRQLGDRLLPFAIRSAPVISEALAEGMTVVDYAPDAPVAEDYFLVANWLRSQAAPAAAGFRNVRWSER